MTDTEIKEYDLNYDLFNELLIKKAEIKKERYQLYISYIKEFGELINQSFESKIECIKKKKLIEYYQAMINKNMNIDPNKAEKYMNSIMSSYYKELEEMKKEYVFSKSFKICSPEEVKEVKKTYRKLAKLIHPDMNKIYISDLKIQEFWIDVCNAYNNNNLEEIQELEIAICKYLSDQGYDCKTIDINDIETKINSLEKEIEDLINSNPYLYKALLSDEDEVIKKKQELNDEIIDSKEYLQTLDQELDDILRNNDINFVEAYA